MGSNHSIYDYEASFARLDGILNQADVNYEEVQELPSRDRLTFSNGFYAYCSALFVDIRDSSGLPTKMRRPTLARLYRAYISELVAIMNGDPYCREVSIVGDAVWCVVNTPGKSGINDVFSTAAQAHSLVKVLNYKLRKRGIPEIRVGIGIDYGRALMIKAGYAGSGINDVVYMGDVVNSAAKHASKGDMTLWMPGPLMIGSAFHQNLSDTNKALTAWNSTHPCYAANVVNASMEEWYQAHWT
jgi:class 3 adenylate cyclase